MMQRAVVVLFPILLALTFSGSANAQVIRFPTPTPTPRPSPSPTPTPEPRVLPCPNVNVQAQPAQMIKDGQPVTFSVNIGGGDPRIQPTILWNLSAGSVKDGQNTRRLTVDSTGAGASLDREIKADVWVGGYAPECVLQASATVKIIAPAAKFGEFGEVADDVLKQNLKVLTDFLTQSPDNLYLIAYAGRKSERGFTVNWVRRIKAGLFTANVDPRRIMAIDGGFREEPTFEFWIVPKGSEPPRPAPTVDRSEIVYPPNPPKKP